ncbi:MAG: glycosyl transferase, partial [uncultured bacterium]
MEKPTVSILIPTLNASSVLGNCLESIKKQNYPAEKIEIIVADGGSSDGTVEIAKKYGAVVVENKLKTGEAGKAAALRAAGGEFAALIDSDNILPDGSWLEQMIEPLLEHEEAVGSEPWQYVWRKEDGFIDRYCSLIGMNDPFVMFLGNYDRVNILTGKWTEVKHDEKDFGDYLLVGLDKRGVPTIGANGTVFRSGFLKNRVRGDYLFDIDILAKEIKEKGFVKFIKVKNGIIHNFCGRDAGKFARKQRRRVKDYLFHLNKKGGREFGWGEMDLGGQRPWGMMKFVLYTLLVVPVVGQAILGFLKKADFAWFFHPVACWITLWEYGWGRVGGYFKTAELSREG